MDVLRGGRTLDIVSRDDADVVVRLACAGPWRARPLVRSGFVFAGRALEQARLVRDRDLGRGDARVERADDRDRRLVGDDLAHVVRAGLRVVRAVERVVVDRRLRDVDLVAAGGAAGLLHGQLDAVDDRVRRRLLAALLGKLDGDRRGALGAVTGRCRRARRERRAAGTGTGAGTRRGAAAAATGAGRRRRRAATGVAARGERQNGDARERTNLAEIHPLSSSSPIGRGSSPTDLGRRLRRPVRAGSRSRARCPGPDPRVGWPLTFVRGDRRTPGRAAVQ